MTNEQLQIVLRRIVDELEVAIDQLHDDLEKAGVGKKEKNTITGRELWAIPELSRILSIVRSIDTDIMTLRGE